MSIFTVINNRERRHFRKQLGPAQELLEKFRRCICENHCSVRIERGYVYWARWYIRFRGVRRPWTWGRGLIFPVQRGGTV